MKKMLRKRVLSVLFLTVFLSIVTAVPAFALTYNVHGYDWRSPIFDGWKNGKSYSLSPGTATQAGHRDIVSWKVTEASDRYYLYGDKVEENNTLEFEGTLSN